MSSTNVVVNLLLAGVNRFITRAEAAKVAMRGFGTEVTKTGKVLTLTTRRTWLFHQALFTLRRLTFGVTLGFLALGTAVVKWGFDFNNQMNQARVGMEGFLPNAQAINKELSEIYTLAAITPFSFKDILLGTRRLLPFQHNVKETNALMEALTNSLSAVGQATGANLTKVTVATAHMLAMNKVTGYQINQFARDNIPLLEMLAHHYGTTTNQIVQMVKQGAIPATEAIKAIIGYQKTAGFEGKNWAMANKTLAGSWATLKDVMAASSGKEQLGIFEGLRKKIFAVNQQLFPFLKAGKPVGMWQFIEALDKGLTPKTHAVAMAFNLAYGFLKSLVYTLGGFLLVLQYTLQAINAILTPFGLFGDKAGTSAYLLRYLGYILGFVTGWFIVYKTAVYTAAVAMFFWESATKAATVAQWLYNFSLKAGREILVLYRIAMIGSWRAANGQFLAHTRLRRAVMAFGNSMIGMRIKLIGITLATWASTAATWALNAALYANPYVWIAVAIIALIGGLVLLYFKWKRFHDAVNDTASFLYQHWYLLSFIPIFGPLIMLMVVVVKYWKEWTGWLERSYNWIDKISKTTIGKKIVSGLELTAKSIIPGFQASGGIDLGARIFGNEENGPKVAKLPSRAQGQPQAASAVGGGGFALSIEPTPVNIDGRQIAEIVWKHRNDRVARR